MINDIDFQIDVFEQDVTSTCCGLAENWMLRSFKVYSQIVTSRNRLISQPVKSS